MPGILGMSDRYFGERAGLQFGFADVGERFGFRLSLTPAAG